MVKEPDRGNWPDKFVDWTKSVDSETFRQLANKLDNASDERPLQEFFTRHPNILVLAFPVHSCWVFPKPRLGGGKYIPDFLLCDRTSLGYKWTLIELENQNFPATNKKAFQVTAITR